ncbi:MAG TPA: transglutaminase-like cysteine peptidase [Microvirga sp.]|nr:transglutaminase-like cysteine peptidase [Microvirga sp.]
MRKRMRAHAGARMWWSCGRLLPLLIVASLPLGLCAAEARAQGSPRRGEPSLSAGGDARPTRAWSEFCRRMPAECAVDPAEPTAIELTPSTWRLIVAVNRRVNRTILSLPDRQHWGVEDRWDYPADGVGDCEDIQIAKRKLLIEAGLPRRALRMTVVVDEKGEGHAVLMVRTQEGEFILDNRRDAVLPWHRTGYVYVMREGDHGATWVSLGRRGSPVVTAKR